MFFLNIFFITRYLDIYHTGNPMIKYEDFTILPFSLCCFPRSFASRPWAKPLASWPRWPRAVRRRSWRSLRRPPFFDVLGSFFCYIYIYICVIYIYIYIICTCIYYMYICTFFSLCIYVHSSLYHLFKVISNTEKTRY